MSEKSVTEFEELDFKCYALEVAQCPWPREGEKWSVLAPDGSEVPCVVGVPQQQVPMVDLFRDDRGHVRSVMKLREYAFCLVSAKNTIYTIAETDWLSALDTGFVKRIQ